MDEIKLRNNAMSVAKRYGLSVAILAGIYRERLKGYNNKQVADTIGVSKTTIQIYLKKIKSMNEKEHILLMKLLFTEYLLDTELVIEDDKIKFAGELK